MTELYAFLFSLGLGIAARVLYIGATALARRTNLLPVTIILDALTAMIVGGAFTAYVIATGTPLAPYMFAVLFAGYLFCYWCTKKPAPRAAKKKPKKRKVAKTE